MSRERVIVDIENLDQALRLEKTVRTGYCDPIAENLVAWIAVEEDLATSYDKLVAGSSKQELKDALSGLAVESRKNIEVLQRLLKSVQELAIARERRQSLIEKFVDSGQ
jgi:hypothetical protein